VLANGAAMFDDGGGSFEERRKDAFDVLGIEQFAERGVSREVRKEDSD
jgi:hypothetical protein